MNPTQRDKMYRAYLSEFLTEIEVELTFATDDHSRVLLWAARAGFTARLAKLDAEIGS